MRVAFFGSPEFATASLRALLDSSHQVVAVVTQPDRPAGRGLKLEAPAVKTLALAHGLPVCQPEKVNSEETLRFLEQHHPEILAVVAYGGFLGRRLLQFGRFAPVNVHPSLLPDLRGAAPMQWSLLRGYKRSGVTTQFMVREMDAGDILLQEETELAPDETAKDLHDRLRLVGGRLLVETLDGLAAGTIAPRPQDPSKATLAPLLTKEQGCLRFSQQNANQLHDQVRGLYPWPGAYTFHQGKRIKVLRSRVTSEGGGGEGREAGTFHLEGDRLLVCCADNSALELLELQPEGRRPLLPKDFVNGMNPAAPHRFDSEPA